MKDVDSKNVSNAKKRPPSNEEFLKMHQETFQYKKF
jgi:hypothetical protein